MLNLAKSGLNVTLVQFSLSLHLVIIGSDLFPMLLEKTFISATQTKVTHKSVLKDQQKNPAESSHLVLVKHSLPSLSTLKFILKQTRI
jgi:hypothetical protein